VESEFGGGGRERERKRKNERENGRWLEKHVEGSGNS